MPREIPPVRPRVTDERRYNRSLRGMVLDPMFNGLRRLLSTASSWTHGIDIVSSQGDAAPGDVREAASERLGLVEAYHRARFERSLRAIPSIDADLFLTRPAVATFMEARVAENVSLIRTIPPRAHTALIADMNRRLQAGTAFNQASLRQLLSSGYRSSGYNLRRLARDQVSKTIGGLTEVRQGQVGITRYRWRTAEDERVRSSHAANNGRIFDWTSPPATGHPSSDVQCRCVAVGIVEDAD